MTMKTIALIAGAAFLMTSPVLAHHSFSMFDHDKTVTISGTVKEFEYTNPHAWLHVMAADEKTGKPTEWSFEMGGVGQVAQQGWKPDTVRPGDKISVEMHPLKDGSHGGQYLGATLADGRSFKNPGAPPVNQNVAR
jgi:hypothetical protein